MRTPDDPDTQPFRPLGPKVTPPAPPKPDEKRIAPGVVEGADGRWHTDLPLPKDTP